MDIVWKSDDDLTIEVQVVRIYLLLELGDDSHPCASDHGSAEQSIIIKKQ